MTNMRFKSIIDSIMYYVISMLANSMVYNPLIVSYYFIANPISSLLYIIFIFQDPIIILF